MKKECLRVQKMQNFNLGAKYDQAEAYYSKAEYDSAYELFVDLAGYRDSSDRMIDIRYKKAEQAIENGELSEAEQMLEELGNDGYNVSTKWRGHYLSSIYNMAAKYCEVDEF